MDIAKKIKEAEDYREYARIVYPALFGEISKKIDWFISSLKAEQVNEGSASSLPAGKKPFANIHVL